MEELLARVRVALRHKTAGATTQLAAGPIRVDIERHRAFIEDVPIYLTPTEFDLLRFLVEQQVRAAIGALIAWALFILWASGPQVWQSIRTYDLQADRAGLGRVLASFSVPSSEQAIMSMLRVRRPATYGAGLLADVTGGFGEMDWRPFLLPVVDGVRASAR